MNLRFDDVAVRSATVIHSVPALLNRF